MGAARFLRSMLGQSHAHKQQEHAAEKRGSALLHWPHRGGVSKDASRSNHSTDDRSVRSTVSQYGVFELSAHGGDACSAAELLQLQQQQQAQQQRPVLPPEVAAAAQQLRALLASTSFFQHKLQCDTATAIRSVEAAAAGMTAAAGAGVHPASAAMPVAAPVRSDSNCGASSSGAAGSMLAVDVALRLSCARGYRVVLRRVLDSKAYWTKAMENVFLVVLDPDSNTEYIVDPHFRELFRTAAMSDAYAALWAALPSAFVGTPAQLAPLVVKLCEEVGRSFAATGRPCPPWRSAAATVNRYMSNGCCDVAVPGPDASYAEVEAYKASCAQLLGGGGGCGRCGTGSCCTCSGGGSSSAYVGGSSIQAASVHTTSAQATGTATQAGSTAAPMVSGSGSSDGYKAAVAAAVAARVELQPLVSVRGFTASYRDGDGRALMAHGRSGSSTPARQQDQQQQQREEPGSLQHGSAAAQVLLHSFMPCPPAAAAADGADGCVGCTPSSLSGYSEELGVLYSSDNGAADADKCRAAGDGHCDMAGVLTDPAAYDDGFETLGHSYDTAGRRVADDVAAAALQIAAEVGAGVAAPMAAAAGNQQAWLNAQSASGSGRAPHNGSFGGHSHVSAFGSSHGGRAGSQSTGCSNSSGSNLSSYGNNCQQGTGVPCADPGRAPIVRTTSANSNSSGGSAASLSRPRSLLTAKLQELRHKGAAVVSHAHQPWQAQGSVVFLQQRLRQQQQQQAAVTGAAAVAAAPVAGQSQAWQQHHHHHEQQQHQQQQQQQQEEDHLQGWQQQLHRLQLQQPHQHQQQQQSWLRRLLPVKADPVA